jgi:hypothetical protein
MENEIPVHAELPRERVARSLRRQGDECESHGSRLYSYLCFRAAADAEAGGVVWRALEEFAADPGRSRLALRFLGAVHRLALDGRAPELARFYPSCGGVAEPQNA